MTNSSSVCESSPSAWPWVVPFLSRLTIGHPEGCVLWVGSVNPDTGYGQLSQKVNGKPTVLYAHRMAWELFCGPIPQGLTVDHLCLNRLCCNTDHMEIVSLSENSRRGCVTRWGEIGAGDTCRHGHVGEYQRTSKGAFYCRACERARYHRRKN